jgi:hypothetical protein
MWTAKIYNPSFVHAPLHCLVCGKPIIEPLGEGTTLGRICDSSQWCEHVVAYVYDRQVSDDHDFNAATAAGRNYQQLYEKAWNQQHDADEYRCEHAIRDIQDADVLDRTDDSMLLRLSVTYTLQTCTSFDVTDNIILRWPRFQGSPVTASVEESNNSDCPSGT